MTETTATKSAEHPQLAGLLNLFVVYLVWGSTYLAIRVGVRPGSGFTPFILAGTRTLVAGLLLILLALAQRRSFALTFREVLRLAVAGIILWLGGNGLVVVAERNLDSSIAALIIGSTPLGVTLMESLIDRRRPSFFLVLSMLVGFTGIGLLSAPAFQTGVKADAWSVLLVLLGSLLWGGGSLYQSRKPVAAAPEIISAIQHLAGSASLLTMAFILREPVPHPVPQAWLAWGYLVVFGSLLAFTAYVRALRLLPTNLVMTYAYVNPVIAVILGALILREPITGWTVSGMVLILAGVAGVFRSRSRQKK